tara:strand:+ start:1247 stop:2737 length:1491 start_codon:yes stop_codon:yes gene_type:complete
MEFLNKIILLGYNFFYNQNYNEAFIDDKFNNYLEYLSAFFQNNFLLIFILIFLFLIIFYLNYFTYNKYNLVFFLNIFVFFIIIILFPSNIPFTDSYNELELLFSKNNFQYFVSGDYSTGFLFVFFRIFHVLIYKYFNLNYNIIIYLNFLIFILSFFLLIFYLKKNNLENYIFLFILIFFNGKWFAHFYEPVNIAWTINLILIFLFIHCFEIENYFKRNFFIFIILLISILNFKAGIIICSYSLILGFLIKDKIKNKIFYILTPFLLYFVIYNFTQSSSIIETRGAQNFLDLLTEKNYIYFLSNFLASHALALTPEIFAIKYFALVFVLIQYSYILNIIFLRNKKYLINFITNNPLIIIGILGCLLINLSKEDYNQSRYMTFSLCFQIGFLVLFLKNISFNLENILIKKKILVSIFLSIYLINLFLPNQGILLAMSKNYVFENINKCFKHNNYKQLCFKEMFVKTFYDTDDAKFDQFKDRIYKLKDKKLSLFYQTKD